MTSSAPADLRQTLLDAESKWARHRELLDADGVWAAAVLGAVISSGGVSPEEVDGELVRRVQSADRRVRREAWDDP